MKNKRFENAAITYDQYAFIQHHSATTIFNHRFESPPRTILDIGCGTGILTQQLSIHFPNADIDALDASAAMIQQLNHRHLKNVSCIHADYSTYKSHKTYDAIVSNAALHWMNVPNCLRQIKKQLGSDGEFVCSIFGSNTSIELSNLLPTINQNLSLPTDQFMDNCQLSEFGRNIFSQWNVKTETITIPFDSITTLFKTQQQTGVNPKSSPNGLWTPRQLKKLETAFINDYGQVQLSYTIHFCVGKMK